MITLAHACPLLDAALAQKASDLHLLDERPAYWRIDGALAPAEPALASAPLLDALDALLASVGRSYGGINHADLGFGYNQRRIRASLYRTLGRRAAVLRVIPATHPSLAAIGVPPAFTTALDTMSGLFLVAGATGDGKSTTLAAAIAYLIARKPAKILTLEDPVEYLHTSGKSLVDQLELGTDFTDFNTALKGALRQDPDVILVGELRDFETFQTACHAATTGHLVLASVHGESAMKTIARVVDTFPEKVRAEQRAIFAQSLTGIYAQQLVKIADGRRAVGELMICTEAIRNLISDNRLDSIPGEIRTGTKHGMRSMDMHLAQLVRAQVLTESAARSRALFPALFTQLLTFV
jgi:twitching motility protein PilT